MSAAGGSVYKTIFCLLCFFTAVSWAADELKEFIPNAAALAVIVLAVATAKALCVLLWFMHVKSERAWKWILLGPTVILAIGLPVALIPDVGLHYYDVDVPQAPLESLSRTGGTGVSSGH